MPRHLITVVETVETATVDTPETPYCTSLVCTCGNDCHNNVTYHLRVTSPLRLDVDDDLLETAIATLGVK